MVNYHLLQVLEATLGQHYHVTVPGLGVTCWQLAFSSISILGAYTLAVSYCGTRSTHASSDKYDRGWPPRSRTSFQLYRS